MTNKTSRSGYDLDVYGLDNGQFYFIHVPAISCIVLSFCCALAVLIFSFKIQNIKTFFDWTKSERFAVYLAISDGLFNIAHTLDHVHIVITRSHVYPPILCEFYGFMLAEFITAQNSLVNLIAINAFVLIYFRKNVDFGKYDWKLLLWTFGLPFIGSTAAVAASQLGPNGTFCFFDGVKGVITNILFTTVPLLLVLMINIVLYALTWHRINTEAKRIKGTVGKNATTVMASHKVAKNMCMFVTAFFIQWWAMAVYGLWQIIDEVPQVLFHFVTTFSNIGGVLNGIVYVLIRRRRQVSNEEKTETPKTDIKELEPTEVNVATISTK